MRSVGAWRCVSDVAWPRPSCWSAVGPRGALGKMRGPRNPSEWSVTGHTGLFAPTRWRNRAVDEATGHPFGHSRTEKSDVLGTVFSALHVLP